MEIRALGGQGLKVGAEGLGLMGMSAHYGATDETESLATIDRALELGVTLLDTAEGYGPFRNEQLLGKALAGRREAAVVATKTGVEFSDEGAFLGHNASPEYIRRSADRSLRHLGTDHIDLYYLHRVDPNVPIEESVGALAELVAAGKVRHIGLCEVSPTTIARAHAVHPLAAVQTEYSLFERGIEHDGVLDTLRDLGIGLVAYSRSDAASSPAPSPAPTTSPTTTSAAATRDSRARTSTATWPSWSRCAARRGEGRHPLAARPGLDAPAGRCPHPGHQAPSLPGGEHRRHHGDDHPEELAAIDAVAPHGVASGDRYAPELMASLNG